MKEGWSQTDYSVPARKAERDERGELDNMWGWGGVMAVVQRDAPHKDTGI